MTKVVYFKQYVTIMFTVAYQGQMERIIVPVIAYLSSDFNDFESFKISSITIY